MINFKPKSVKKIVSAKNKGSITLDSKHNEFIEKFNNNDNIVIPDLQNQIADMKTKINLLNIDSQGYKDISKEIKEKKKIIKSLNNQKKEYYLNNSEILFDYFEKKKEVSEGTNKKKILDNFFSNIEPSTNNDTKVDQSESNKYFMNIDNNYLDINYYVESNDMCNNCSGELVAVESDGVLICKACSSQFTYLVEHEKPSYKEPPKEVCFYAYKKLNHFKEILAQFQAKETTHIPPIVLDDVLRQIKKERIQLEDFTHIKAKEILKKLGYNKYYEHISFIKDKLGIKPPVMSLELEERLINLFLETQKPYAKYCPEDRLNYLNYYYVLYKLCEMLDEKYYLQFCPMLKDPIKKIEQDEIWKKICADLGWQFIPTVI